MSKRYTFDKESMKRVANVTRTVENLPVNLVGQRRAPKGKPGANGVSSPMRFAKVSARVSSWQYVANIYNALDIDGSTTLAVPVEEDSDVYVCKDSLADGEVIPNGTVLTVRQVDRGGETVWMVVEHLGMI